ncbi:EamA family transporter [Streptomyces sp. NPDC050610]|uniref:DMT family transporter n=1 Tax=Streptomyces sp. NPDC050610 TaxID=3157097 RepID=UPI00342DC3A1
MRQQMHGFFGGAGLVLGAMLLWGTVGPAQALAGTPMGPAALGGWRLVVGGVVLGVCARRHLPALIPAMRQGLARPLLICAAATGVYQAAFLFSAARTGAALATTVALGTAPVATGLIARAVGGERLTRTWLISTAAAVTGCVLLSAPTGAGVDALGLPAAAASGVCFGLYTVFAKKLAADHPGVHLPTVSALALLLGAVPLVPWVVTDAGSLGEPAALGLIAWLGVAATALPYWLFSVGITFTSAATVATLCLAEPLAASFLGVFVLHEHLTATAVLGSLLMLGGLAAACLPAPRPEAAPATAPTAIPPTATPATATPRTQEQ